MEALFEFAQQDLIGIATSLLFGQFQIVDGVGVSFVIGLVSVGQQHLIELSQGKAAELLCRSHQRNVTDHLKSREHGLGFGVLNVTHLKAAFKHCLDIEKAAVNATEDHVTEVMNIDVTALNEFLFLGRKGELFVEALC